MRRPIGIQRAALLGVALLLVGSACTASGGEPAPVPSQGTVTIGTGPEPESVLLATVTAELARRAGYLPEVVELADRTAARRALEVGDVDLLPGYTGQAWLEELGQADPPGDPRTSFARVATADERRGVRWLRPRFELDGGATGPPANATFGLFVQGGEDGSDPAARTITQLATLLAERPDALVCVDPEFAQRDDGWEAVADAYAIADRVLTEARPAQAVQGVALGDCLVGLSTTTDGQAWAEGLQLLADPLAVFPAFVVTLQVREEVADRQPTLVEAVRPLAEELTTALLGAWNGQVLAGVPVAEVVVGAADLLQERAGVLPTPSPPSG